MVLPLVHTGDPKCITHVLLPKLVALKASLGLGFCFFPFIYSGVFHKYAPIFPIIKVIYSLYEYMLCLCIMNK